jgi:SAM-dependent methyltransferase
VPVSASFWNTYNATQVGRAPRPFVQEVLGRLTAGGGRLALDLGCGAGMDTRALWQAGWRVWALDVADETPRLVAATFGVSSPEDLPRGVSVIVGSLEATDLPQADLVHASFSLPFVARDEFGDVWARVLGCLRPGGLLAVSLFGVDDSWAARDDVTVHRRAEVDALLAELDVESLDEVHRDGEAFEGPKHWHIYFLVARRPAPGSPGVSPTR